MFFIRLPIIELTLFSQCLGDQVCASEGAGKAGTCVDPPPSCTLGTKTDCTACGKPVSLWKIVGGIELYSANTSIFSAKATRSARLWFQESQVSVSILLRPATWVQ